MVDEVASYSPLTGLIYIFNLIVGTGALTLPAAFHDAGWALSASIMAMLAFMSYLTATFMIESMASANAIIHWKRLQRRKRASGSVDEDTRTMIIGNDGEISTPGSRSGTPQTLSRPSSSASNYSSHLVAGQDSPSNFHYINRTHDTEDETEPLILPADTASDEVIEERNHHDNNYYEIVRVVEMGKMASMFFSKIGMTLFYLCICIYLYGDLAIYGAAVAKSLRDVTCQKSNASSANVTDDEPCWETWDVSRLNAYRIMLTLFVVVIAPFCFRGVTKTKYLQLFTSLMRWMAFVCMVTLTTIRLINGKVVHPDVANVSGLPNLFGVCIYSFMCHHSLPSLVTPITRKKRIYTLLFADYFVILAFYFLLSFTGIFTFAEIDDLYTLNFKPVPGEPVYMKLVHYFLSLFPVFTLSTNFPIIAITLRNNLKSLFLTEGRMYSSFTRNWLFFIMTLVPPVAVAFATNRLEFLVGITGSYAGAGIQYVVPAFLVYTSRSMTHKAIGIGVRNHHASAFKSTFWVFFVNLWAIACVVLVTWNHIANAAKTP